MTCMLLMVIQESDWVVLWFQRVFFGKYVPLVS